MTQDHEGGLDRRQTLKCMLWAGTGVVWTVAGGVPVVAAHRLGESGGRRLFLHSDLRQPHRLRQARQSGRARHARRSDRQDCSDARQARVHDPHRRHQPHGEGERIRRRAANDRPRQARRPLCARRTRHPRSQDARRLSRALRQGRDRRRLVLVRPGRRAFRIAQQCRRPQEERPWLARRGAARVAGRRSQGQIRFDAHRHLLAHPALDDRARMGLGHRGFGAGAWAISRASAR